MKKRFLPIIFLLITIMSLYGYPSIALALSQDEALDKLIDISLIIVSLKKQVNELSIEVFKLFRPSELLALGDYLKNLFEDHEIVLEKDDFLELVQDPYITAAKILNLIPSYYESNQKITPVEAEQISEQFLLIKDKILLDSLYGKIDMHEHYQYGGNMEEFLRAAGSLGISKIVFVPTGLSPDNQGYKTHQKVLIKYMKEVYPDRIIPFCTIDEADHTAAEVFEECLRAGGEGLKLLGGHPKFYDEPLNSENMYKVYKIAAEYRVPVLIHASIINIPELKNQLDQVYSDFPDVTFIHAHYCSTIMKGINLDQCAELLDKHPNLYTDLTMGGGIKRYHGYFRQDLDGVKDFILTYQDRILFGSDIILNRLASKDLDWFYQRISCDIDLHQKEEYTCSFGEKDLTHQGFNLDEKILKKLYFENPKKALNL